MNKTEKDRIRLSDKVLSALQLSLEQEDLSVSEQLACALDLTLMRKPSDDQFVERRDYPLEIEDAINKLSTLRNKVENKGT